MIYVILRIWWRLELEEYFSKDCYSLCAKTCAFMYLKLPSTQAILNFFKVVGNDHT